MLYLLCGDIYQIEQKLNELLIEFKVNDNISKYELDAYNYKDVLEDADTYTLFDDKKVIIVKNASIFTSTNKTIDLEPFENYFNNPNPNTYLVFITTDKLDERRKVTKLIRKVGYVYEYSDMDIDSYIKDSLKEYKIDDDAVLEFTKLVGTDILNVSNEIDKLKLYKSDDIITLNDILNVTTKNVDIDLFKLMDAIIDNDKEKSLTYYNNMLKYNVEPIQIIIALANKYRLMYQVKTLKKLGYTDNDIAKELKQNPKYIFVLNKLGYKYTDKYLLNELKKLADLDYNIKSGKMDSKLGLELYILKK